MSISSIQEFIACHVACTLHQLDIKALLVFLIHDLMNSTLTESIGGDATH
jgi:hypothetical protein